MESESNLKPQIVIDVGKKIDLTVIDLNISLSSSPLGREDLSPEKKYALQRQLENFGSAFFSAENQTHGDICRVLCVGEYIFASPNNQLRRVVSFAKSYIYLYTRDNGWQPK